MSRLDQLRANLEAANAPADEEEAAPDEVEAPEPAEEAPEPAQADGQQGRPMETLSPELAAEKARDEKGRFQKAQEKAERAAVKPTPSKLGGKAPAQKPQDAAAGPGTQAGAGGQSPGPTLRPPANWKPQAKEHWAKLPPEVQQEALRVDKEVARTLQESKGARDFHGAFQQTMAPFSGMLAADRAQPLEAIRNVFQTVAGLRMGTQAQKDAIIATIIQDFGGSVEGINAHLSGQAQPMRQQQPPQQQPQAFRDPRLDQILEQQRTALAQEAQSTLEDFVQSNEFMDRHAFRVLVADLMDRAREAGRPIPIEEAYEFAKTLDPDVKSVLAQRKAAEAAKAAQASTQRSMRAASSVRSQPAGVVQVSSVEAPKSRRELMSQIAARARGEE